MLVSAIKTRLAQKGEPINGFIAEALPRLPERSVVVIASKIFSFCENRLVVKNSEDKEEKWSWAKKEADWWLDPNNSKYQCMLTIKGSWMFANAGIDESNAENRYYALWPRNPQASVNQVWQFLRDHYGVKEVGVIMSDSGGLPLNWGVIGHAVAHCGFEAIRSYISQPDLYGRLLQMERTNMMQSLVSAATVEMGEGNEQTPIAILSDIGQIIYQDRCPTQEELDFLHISLEDDIYEPLVAKAPWQKGGGGVDL